LRLTQQFLRTQRERLGQSRKVFFVLDIEGLFVLYKLRISLRLSSPTTPIFSVK